MALTKIQPSGINELGNYLVNAIQVTANLEANTATVAANVITNGLSVNTSATIGTSLGVTGNVTAGNATVLGTLTTDTLTVAGGLQNTPVGNAIASTGNFTTLDANANATVNALTVNNSATIGSGLGVTGNVIVTSGNIFGQRFNSTSQQLSPPVQGSDVGYRLTVYDFNQNSVNYGIGAEGGHVWFAVDSYADTDGFKFYGNVNQVARISALGNFYLDGNVVSSNSGSFTKTLSANGNITGGNLISNGSISAALTLTASGGIQGTAIGNVTPDVGYFTNLQSSGTATVNELVSNGAVSGTSGSFGSLGISGNLTVDALIVNTSANIGTTLTANGGIQGTAIGNAAAAAGYFTTLDSSANASFAAATVTGNATFGNYVGISGITTISNTTQSNDPFTGALVVTGGAGIGGNLNVSGNLNVTGNVSYFSANDLVISDPLIFIGEGNSGDVVDLGFIVSWTSANLQHGGFVRDASDGVWKLFGNVIPEPTTVVDFANAIYQPLLVGTLTSGNIFAAEFGNAGATFTGATYTASNSFNGNLNGQIGTAGGNSAIFSTTSTTSNASIQDLTVNGSATIGTTLGVTGNVTASYFIGNLVGNISGNISAAGANTQVQFNDNGVTAGDPGFVYNKSTDALTVSGATTIGANLIANGLSVNSSAVIGTVLSVAGGIQNTVIGNVTAAAGYFTNLNATGNITAQVINSNSSIDAGTTITAAGGLQNTVIGNVTPSSAQFTTVSTSANATVANLTVNGSATVGTTLGVTGNVSADYFLGNGRFLTGIDTTLISNGISNVKVYQDSNIAVSASGVANILVISASGITASQTFFGTTVEAATIGNSGALLTGTLTTAAQPNVTSVGNTLTIGTITVGSNTISSTNSVITIDPANTGNTGTVVIEGNLQVTGNIITVNSEIVTINDKDLMLANNQSTTLGIDGAGILLGNIGGQGIATWTYNYSTGSWRSNVHITPLGNAVLSLGGTSNYWADAYVANLRAVNIDGTLTTASQPNITNVGTLQSLTLSGTLTGTTIEAATIGNAGATLTGATLNTSGNATVNGLTVNVDATIGGNLGVTNNITVTGNVSADTFIGEFSGNVNGNIAASGANTQVQFNNNGILGASANLQFNSATNTLITNALTVNATATFGNATASNLTVNGISNLGNVGNVRITGGAQDQYLSTDGSGNLSWKSFANSFITVDSFVGTGAQVNFNLSVTPSSENYVLVNIDGVSQLHTSFDVSGNVLQMSAPPVSGANIEAVIFTLAGGGAGGPSQNRVVVYNDSSTITFNVSTTDLAIQTNTQGFGNLNVAAPIGTPLNGQKIMWRLQSTNSQNFNFNGVFQGSTDIPLPAISSGSSKYDYLEFIYNSTSNTWQLIRKTFGF